MPRLTEARYADGLGELYATEDPVLISQHIFDQEGDMPNSANLSTMFTTWGQFLDHDLSLSPEQHADEGGETFADGLGNDIGRSEFAEGSGVDSARVQLNGISWQLDAGNVYGHGVRTDDVRSFEDGKLTLIDDPTSDRGLLPKAWAETLMAGEIEGDDTVFLAGDIRANENPNLLAMHTMWAREHNYWAEKLAEEHPDWDDDQLFAGARQIVEYNQQSITYNEWLPHLVGNAVGDPEGIAYDAAVDGEVSIEFSTAAFRFGHTLVSSQLDRVNEDGTEAEGGHLSLMDSFFNHHAVEANGIDSLFRGMSSQNAQELDAKVIDDLNFFLASPDGVASFSLVVLNLMRGADHGLQSYVDTRAALLQDIDPATMDPTDFSIITSDVAVQAELASVYDTVHDVDLWVGGLAEDAAPGAQTGHLFTYIISEQFGRTAAGDETFLQLDASLGADIIAEVQATNTLSDVILRNTDIDTIDDDPFTAQARGLEMVIGDVMGVQDGEFMELAAEDITGDVNLLGGDDMVMVTGGTHMAGDLMLGNGDDTMMMSSGHVDNQVISGAGDDLLMLTKTAHIAGDVQTNSGDDMVVMSDVAWVEGDIMTGSGQDTVMLANSTQMMGAVRTGSGSDMVDIDTDQTDVTVFTGSQSDIVNLVSGSGMIRTGSSDDTVMMSNIDSDVETLVRMGSGNDNIDASEGGSVAAAGGSGADDMVGSDDADRLFGGSGNDFIYGNNGADRVMGARGDDVLIAGQGNDYLNGGSGNDNMSGDSGNDRMFGSSGDDVMRGGSGDDTLNGGWGSDDLRGGAGDDVLSTGGGNSGDLLQGGLGDDALYFGANTSTTASGGFGSDTFTLRTNSSDGTVQGQHVITDFDSGEDILNLSDMSDDQVLEFLFGQGDGNDLKIQNVGGDGSDYLLIEDQEEDDAYWAPFL